MPFLPSQKDELAHKIVNGWLRNKLTFSFHHDAGSGVDKRSGWSVSINGRHVTRFAASLEDAVLEAAAELMQRFSVKA